MSSIEQASKIRPIRDLRIGRRQAAMVIGGVAWVVGVNVAVAHTPMQLIPNGSVGVLAFVLAPVIALWVGVVPLLGYHRARGPFPRVVWHFSPAEWSLGQDVELDLHRCRNRSRLFCLTRPGRRATYVFERRPRKSDIAANRAGRGMLYKLQVTSVPALYYRRWDGTGAMASLEPLTARVIASHAVPDIH